MSPLSCIPAERSSTFAEDSLIYFRNSNASLDYLRWLSGWGISERICWWCLRSLELSCTSWCGGTTRILDTILKTPALRWWDLFFSCSRASRHFKPCSSLVWQRTVRLFLRQYKNWITCHVVGLCSISTNAEELKRLVTATTMLLFYFWVRINPRTGARGECFVRNVEGKNNLQHWTTRRTTRRTKLHRRGTYEFTGIL